VNGSGRVFAGRPALALATLSFIVRASVTSSARFTGDESWFWATARNIATFETSSTYGPSLTGSNAYHPGPLFYYLMAIPQRLGASPYFGSVFVALLHALAGWMLYLVAREAIGERGGLIALALFAFAPWDVLYADRIWLSCVAPVWGTAVLFLAASPVVLESTAVAQGALMFFGVTLPELHMSAPIVWVAAAVMLWLKPPARWNRRALLVGALLGALTYAAPLWNELHHDFVNTRAILSEGTGKEKLDVALTSPLRVFGYAVLYASNEISYHFDTGYWRPFFNSKRYLELEGWARWFRHEGALFSGLGLVSMAAAVLADVAATFAVGRRALRALRERRKDALGPFDRMALGLFMALVAASLLIMLSKKSYFPHYTNLLMPFLLLPLAAWVDWLWARRPVDARILLGLLVAAMAGSTLRYYREVDRLNGLEATLEMVERVISGPMPVSVGFDGFHNAFAWEMLANTKHGRPLRTDGRAPVHFQVHNQRPHDEAQPLPPGGTLHGAVVLEQR
jgi:hypothetical protein